MSLPRGYKNMPAVGPPTFDKLRMETLEYVEDPHVVEQIHKLITVIEQVHAELWMYKVDSK